MTDTRTRLDALLEVPLSEGEWQALQREGSLGWLEELDAGTWTLGELATRVRQQRAIFGHAPRARPRQSDGASSRSFNAGAYAYARGIVDARHARNDVHVRAFRSDVMGGQVITREAVADWIEERKRNSASAPGTRSELHYAMPGDEYLRRAAVAPGTDLDRLRQLSERLAARYSWQPAQASIFVLADVAPVVAPIRVRMSAKTHGGSRVTIDAEIGVPPKKVAEAFARAASGGAFLCPRPAISERHCMLAAFLAERLTDPDPTQPNAVGATPGNWDELRRAWNAEHPDWRYSERSNFQRDATSALERVVAS